MEEFQSFTASGAQDDGFGDFGDFAEATPQQEEDGGFGNWADHTNDP